MFVIFLLASINCSFLLEYTVKSFSDPNIETLYHALGARATVIVDRSTKTLQIKGLCNFCEKSTKSNKFSCRATHCTDKNCQKQKCSNGLSVIEEALLSVFEHSSQEFTRNPKQMIRIQGPIIYITMSLNQHPTGHRFKLVSLAQTKIGNTTQFKPVIGGLENLKLPNSTLKTGNSSTPILNLSGLNLGTNNISIPKITLPSIQVPGTNTTSGLKTNNLLGLLGNTTNTVQQAASSIGNISIPAKPTLSLSGLKTNLSTLTLPKINATSPASPLTSANPKINATNPASLLTSANQVVKSKEVIAPVAKPTTTITPTATTAPALAPATTSISAAHQLAIKQAETLKLALAHQTALFELAKKTAAIKLAKKTAELEAMKKAAELAGKQPATTAETEKAAALEAAKKVAILDAVAKSTALEAAQKTLAIEKDKTAAAIEEDKKASDLAKKEEYVLQEQSTATATPVVTTAAPAAAISVPKTAAELEFEKRVAELATGHAILLTHVKRVEAIVAKQKLVEAEQAAKAAKLLYLRNALMKHIQKAILLGKLAEAAKISALKKKTDEAILLEASKAKAEAEAARKAKLAEEIAKAKAIADIATEKAAVEAAKKAADLAKTNRASSFFPTHKAMSMSFFPRATGSRSGSSFFPRVGKSPNIRTVMNQMNPPRFPSAPVLTYPGSINQVLQTHPGLTNLPLPTKPGLPTPIRPMVSPVSGVAPGIQHRSVIPPTYPGSVRGSASFFPTLSSAKNLGRSKFFKPNSNFFSPQSKFYRPSQAVPLSSPYSSGINKPTTHKVYSSIYSAGARPVKPFRSTAVPLRHQPYMNNVKRGPSTDMRITSPVSTKTSTKYNPNYSSASKTSTITNRMYPNHVNTPAAQINQNLRYVRSPVTGRYSYTASNTRPTNIYNIVSGPTSPQTTRTQYTQSSATTNPYKNIVVQNRNSYQITPMTQHNKNTAVQNKNPYQITQHNQINMNYKTTMSSTPQIINSSQSKTWTNQNYNQGSALIKTATTPAKQTSGSNLPDFEIMRLSNPNLNEMYRKLQRHTILKYNQGTYSINLCNTCTANFKNNSKQFYCHKLNSFGSKITCNNSLGYIENFILGILNLKNMQFKAVPGAPGYYIVQGLNKSYILIKALKGNKTIDHPGIQRSINNSRGNY